MRPKVNDPVTWLDISGYGVSSHHSKTGGDGTGMDLTTDSIVVTFNVPNSFSWIVKTALPEQVRAGVVRTGMDKTVANLRASPRVNRRVYHRGENTPIGVFRLPSIVIPTSGATKNLSILGLADPSLQSG